MFLKNFHLKLRANGIYKEQPKGLLIPVDTFKNIRNINCKKPLILATILDLVPIKEKSQKFSY